MRVLNNVGGDMTRTFEPLGDRVVIKQLEQEEVSRGGLVLPDSAKEKPQEGEVIAIGPGRLTDDGKRLPMELTVGDKILYARYAGTEVKGDDDEEELLVLRESDILAKLG
jgi:chaperonin GroES